MSKLFLPGYQFLGSTGAPVDSGTVTFYENGTTTLKTIYTNAAMSSAATNPAPLNSAGRFNQGDLYGSGVYTVVLKDSASTQLWSRDDYDPDDSFVTLTVTTYDADPTGAADSAAAFTAAIAALPSAGGAIYVPRGTYKLASTITIGKPCYLYGDGYEVTIIKTSSATAVVFSVTNAYVHIDKMSFQTSITRTAGAYVHFTNTTSVTELSSFMMTGYYIGVLQESTTCNIHHGRLVNGATTSGSGGVKLDKASAIDTRIDSITMDAPVGSQPTFGINLLYADATMITNCDIIHHTSNLLINPITGTVVSGTYVENSFFDSAVKGLNMPATLAGTVQLFRAKGCWFGNQTSQGVYMSTTTGVIDGVDFDDCYMALNTDYGLLVDPGCLNIKVNGGQYAANLQGIGFGANVTHCSVIGARIGTVSAQAGNTNYGIVLAASNDYMTIKDNDLVGNGVAAMSNSSTGAHNIIYDNLGHVPTPIGVTANIPMGAVAYGSLGTAVSHVAGTIYVAEIYIPHAKAITGIAILNAGTVGTSLGIVALYGPDGGAALATSALAGTVSANANALQSIPFTASLTIWQPGRYFIAFQANNATDNIRCIAASTYLNWTKSFTGVFGTIASLTVPTSTAADVGPIGLVY